LAAGGAAGGALVEAAGAAGCGVGAGLVGCDFLEQEMQAQANAQAMRSRRCGVGVRELDMIAPTRWD